MKTSFRIIVSLLFFALPLSAQPAAEQYSAYGEILRFQLSSAPFPHPKRERGHTYNGKVYTAEEHYRDSSVAVFVPKNFRTSNRTDLVIYFHGWFNTIDSTLAQFRLVEQFTESGKNALLVIPEGPRNAPDSYGGKLEDAGGFKRFMTDVANVLFAKKVIKSKQIGKIILAGHSGGYHVISFVLLRGKMPVTEVYLLDALYGQTEKFTYWLGHTKGKLIVSYTNEGGTMNEAESLQEDLAGWNVPYCAKEEKELTQADLQRQRLIFIHTDLQHNDVVAVRNQFRDYLRASSLASRRMK